MVHEPLIDVYVGFLPELTEDPAVLVVIGRTLDLDVKVGFHKFVNESLFREETVYFFFRVGRPAFGTVDAAESHPPVDPHTKSETDLRVHGVSVYNAGHQTVVSLH